MRRSKIILATSALAISVALTGCSGDSSSPEADSSASASDSAAASSSPSESGDASSDAYCQELDAAQGDFAALASGDASSIDKTFQTFSDLGDSAPPEVADDWKVINDAFGGLEKSLESAGVDLSDLSSGKLPKNVNPKKLQTLQSDVAALQSPDFTEAGQNISDYAQSECNIDFGG